MRGIGGKPCLLGKGGIQPGEGGVQHGGELAEFAAGVFNGDALGEIARGDLAGGDTDFMDRAQSPRHQPGPHGQAQQQHRQTNTGKPPGELAQSGGFSGNGPAHEHAIIRARKQKGFAELAALANGRRTRPRKRHIGRRGGRVNDRCLTMVQPHNVITGTIATAIKEGGVPGGYGKRAQLAFARPDGML